MDIKILLDDMYPHYVIKLIFVV